jgi:hypothetical protein
VHPDRNREPAAPDVRSNAQVRKLGKERNPFGFPEATRACDRRLHDIDAAFGDQRVEFG